jgi:hypothetical protein
VAKPLDGKTTDVPTNQNQSVLLTKNYRYFQSVLTINSRYHTVAVPAETTVPTSTGTFTVTASRRACTSNSQSCICTLMHRNDQHPPDLCPVY